MNRQSLTDITFNKLVFNGGLIVFYIENKRATLQTVLRLNMGIVIETFQVDLVVGILNSEFVVFGF